MIIRATETRRSGAMSVAFLIAVPILLLVVGLVLYVGLLRDIRTETQNGADAAALAAAWKLATDDLLTDSIRRATKRLTDSKLAAIALGQANFAGGDRLDLDDNPKFDPTNPKFDPDSDIVFGHLDHPLGGTFDAIDADSTKWVGNYVNAVRVKARRNPVRAPMGGPTADRDVLALATAMLDFSVVGFRPNNDLPIPLVPLAILTDHKGVLPNGWDTRLLTASDLASFDPATKKFTRGSDGIPEVTVIIGPPSPEESSDPSVVFLKIGAHSLAHTVEQIRLGIARTDFDGDFVLGTDNTLSLPGSPDCPEPGSDARDIVDKALDDMREAGAPRIWPLYSAIGRDGTVQVTGWMAARIVSVQPTRGGGIKLILQPAVVCHTSAVTEQRADTPPAFWVNNRTICRVRLAD